MRRQGARRHGVDRGRAPGAGGRRRAVAEGDARRRSGSWTCRAPGAQLLGNLRAGRCAARSPGRLVRHARPRRRSARPSSSSCSWPTASTSSGGSSGSTKQAKSGDPALRAEVGAARADPRPPRRGRDAARSSEELPAELEPLTTKPLIEVVNGPEGIDLEARGRARRAVGEEAAAFREGPSGARGRRAPALRRARPRELLHGAATRRRAPGRSGAGQTALDAAGAIHTDIARGFIRCEVIGWDDLVDCGSHAEAARRGLVRLEGKDVRGRGRRRPERSASTSDASCSSPST